METPNQQVLPPGSIKPTPQAPVNNPVPTPQELIVDVARDYRETGLSMASLSSIKADILRDYVGTGLAFLGGSLTILTVSPNLPKTRSLLFTGSLIVLASVIIGFETRHKLGLHAESIIGYRETEYTNLVGPARTLVNAPSDPVAMNSLKIAVENMKKIPPTPVGLAKFGYRLTALLLLGGCLAIAASLILKITF